jgi:hypothetical protein
MAQQLNKANGTQLAVVGTEHTLLTETGSGIFTLMVDLVNMVAGDAVTLRAYTKVLTGGTAHLIYGQTFGNAQGDGVTVGSKAGGMVIVKSPPIESPFQLVWTLTQELGTGRNFPWREDQIG